MGKVLVTIKLTNLSDEILRGEGFRKAAQFLKGLLIELPQGKLWFDEDAEGLGSTEEGKR